VEHCMGRPLQAHLAEFARRQGKSTTQPLR
jgi:hypothetical protein